MYKVYHILKVLVKIEMFFLTICVIMCRRLYGHQIIHQSRIEPFLVIRIFPYIQWLKLTSAFEQPSSDVLNLSSDKK